MCGISGFVDYSKISDKKVLEKMNRTLAHRGPDGEGYAIFQTHNACVGLGHRRLSIIDLTSGGSQPKTFQNLHITFNGEVYNYEEIKIELEALGHFFDSHSDTEVVLHAYHQWGSGALQKFTGMFAFVIYDDAAQKLFACRDRAGVKPFFYHKINDLVLFGSELKALVQHPKFEKKINLDAVAAYMKLGTVPTPHCIFQHTHKLKPGHFLEIDIKQNTLTTMQYWNVYDAYNKPTLNIDFPEALLETEKILAKAFNYRMVSDVPVGVFLSGGYDSSCVTALLQKNSTEKIKTFTIGMPDAGLNEAPYAKDIAAYLGTDHTEVYCTQKEALEIVPQLPFYYDEPFADSSAIPTMLVSKIAREKVTVALSADAGDEVFAGYGKYDYMLRYGKKLNSVPGFVRKVAAGIMHTIPPNAIPVFNKKYLFESRYEKLKGLLKNPSDKNILKSISTAINEGSIARLFKTKTSILQTGFDSEELLESNYNSLAYTMAIDYETYLLDDILQKVDRATMSASLEGRDPFLDHKVIEWAAQLPMKYKYNNGNKKYILKEIVHKYLPKEMMDRPKMGFGIPLANWLNSDLKKYVDQYFDTDFVIKQNIFDIKEIQRIKKAFYENKTERADIVWYILMFQMWYDKWINNN
jgi:asparagine synthase (glutamine-hydrolysing)